MLVLTIPCLPCLPYPSEILEILALSCLRVSKILRILLLTQSTCHSPLLFYLQHLLAAWPESFTIDLPYISHTLTIKSINRIKENPTYVYIILQHLLAAWPKSFTIDLPCVSHTLTIKNPSFILFFILTHSYLT